MIRSLSKQEYDLLSKFAIRNVKVISTKDIKKVSCFSDGKIRVMLHRLQKKGWLERIKKGTYLIVPIEGRDGWAEHPFVVLPNLVKNYYVSYRSALAYYGFTEQIPFYIFSATTERKNSLNFQGYIYRFARMDERKFFGFEKTKISGVEINVADKEKAVIDCIDKEEYAGSIIETFRAIKDNTKQFDFVKMINYAVKMKSKSLIRRLGYLLNLAGQDAKELENKTGKFRHIYLSNVLPKRKVKLNKKWKLILNIEENELSK